MESYDIAIIGAGVTGSMIARSLSEYSLSVVVLEKENDVATGSSGANSGIVHAGFDPVPGTLKAALNVPGCNMMPYVAKELDVPYYQNGSLVLAFTHDEVKTLERLYRQGRENGVKSLDIIDSASLRKLEPQVSPEAVAALYAPTAGIICPYNLTIAAIGNAMDNGVTLLRNYKVSSIKRIPYGLEIHGTGPAIAASVVINASGLFADEISELVGDSSFKLLPRKGEYTLLDSCADSLVKHTIFQTPGSMGKGVLVTPTVHGNILVGPTAEDVTDKEDKNTGKSGQQQLWQQALKSVPGLNKEYQITAFAGLRSSCASKDFIIRQSMNCEALIHVAAIDSPGLASSPAIAAYVLVLLSRMGVLKGRKMSFNPYRQGIPVVKNLPLDERASLIRRNPAYGNIICRCEEISEGEIVEAIHKNPGALDVDGVKRRVRPGMGRCQGGFCLPGVMEILSRELNIPMENITKKGKNSLILTGQTR